MVLLKVIATSIVLVSWTVKFFCFDADLELGPPTPAKWHALEEASQEIRGFQRYVAALLPFVSLDGRVADLHALERGDGRGHLIGGGELEQTLALLQHPGPVAVASLLAQLHQVFDGGALRHSVDPHALREPVDGPDLGGEFLGAFDARSHVCTITRTLLADTSGVQGRRRCMRQKCAQWTHGMWTIYVRAPLPHVRTLRGKCVRNRQLGLRKKQALPPRCFLSLSTKEPEAHGRNPLHSSG